MPQSKGQQSDQRCSFAQLAVIGAIEGDSVAVRLLSGRICLTAAGLAASSFTFPKHCLALDTEPRSMARKPA